MLPTLLDSGAEFIKAVQAAAPNLAWFFNLFTFLGTIEFYLVSLPVVYWIVNSRLRLRLSLFFAVSVVVNTVLKMAFFSPRPYWVDSQIRLLTAPEYTFGLPSGHAQHSVVFWGTIGAAVRRGWVWAVLISLAVLTGVSRIYLGVHFPIDTLAGWTVGGLLLVLLLRAEAPVRGWFHQRSVAAASGAVLLLGVLAIGLGFATAAVMASSQAVPEAWIQGAALQAPDEPITPLAVVDMVSIAATIVGLLSGHFWLAARGSFSGAGSWQQRFGRIALGLVGVVAIWAGLDAAFSALAADESALGYGLRFVRYVCVGLWVGLAAPLIFLRLGLAQPAPARTISP
jgi:membrane-associated phospholipid phosphatase